VRGDVMAGVVIAESVAGFPADFTQAIARHRFWERDATQQMGGTVRP